MIFNIPSPVLCLVTQSYSTLCDPMDCSPPGSSVHGDPPGKNPGSGFPCPLPGALHNPGIKLMSSALQVDSLPLSHEGSQHIYLILYKLLISSLKAFLPILIFHLCVYPATHIFIRISEIFVLLWLISLSIIPSRFIHACVLSHFSCVWVFVTYGL